MADAVTLALSPLECKVLWLIMDRATYWPSLSPEMRQAEPQLFDKVYRAYRGMPPNAAA